MVEAEIVSETSEFYSVSMSRLIAREDIITFSRSEDCVQLNPFQILTEFLRHYTRWKQSKGVGH
jgi:hypothetical protein